MSVELSQICITAAESWIWPVVAINKNKRQCGVIVTLFLVSIKVSLQNMFGSFSVRGCTAQPFSTALPTKSNSFSGTEDKAVLGKRSGYLFKVKSEDLGVLHHSMQSKEGSCVCFGYSRRGRGAAFAHLQQPCPRHCRRARCFPLVSGQCWPLSHPPHCQGNGIWWDPILGLYELL